MRSSPVTQPDLIVPTSVRRQPAVRFLREHPQRAGVDAAPLLGQERERVVGLARVRRTEVRDDALGLAAPLGEPDLDGLLGSLHRRAPVTRRSRERGAASGSAASAVGSPGCSRRTVARIGRNGRV